MGVFEFLTVVVIFGSIFGYLKARRNIPDRERLEVLERRIVELERAQRSGDLAQRVEVLEQIVVVEDYGLERKIRGLASASQPALPEASVAAESRGQSVGAGT